MLVREMGLGCCVKVEGILYILGDDQRSQNIDDGSQKGAGLLGTVS